MLGLDMLHLAIHEGYPGHHAERCIKEQLLVRERGMLEETIVLVPTPQSLVAEGIAELAPSLLLEGEGGEALAAVAGDAGLPVDLAHSLAVDRAAGSRRWVQVNAALMLHEQGAGEAEVRAYLERWGLMTPELSAHLIRFMNEPTSRSYVITYPAGQALCRAWVAGDPRPVPPAAVRAGAGGGAGGVAERRPAGARRPDPASKFHLQRTQHWGRSLVLRPLPGRDLRVTMSVTRRSRTCVHRNGRARPRCCGPPALGRSPGGRATAGKVASVRRMEDDIIITTMNDLPGYEVVEVYGEVFGLIVRARNVFSNIGAGFRTVFGGEAKGYTSLLSDSRNHAVDRLRDAARERGANAVLAMRFDCNEIADIMSEVAAYGTAVRVRKL